MFEQHLSWLKTHCMVIPFSKIPEVMGREGLGRPTVSITFDDGYEDNYEYAFPLLQQYRIPATFFVTVGLVEKDPAVVERFQMLRQCDYKHIRPLEWRQMDEMRKEGMEFGVHTYSHPNLARLKRDAAERELKRSKDIMEERLGKQISLMAYPFGKPKRHFTEETIELVANIGYEYAAAIAFRAVRVSDSPFDIPRFFVTMDPLGILREKVWGAWDVVGYWQEKAPLWLAKMISPADFKV
jgi:peptidoglycan/xylan/chitin deacetylase (PgdA/CDA1 family)